LYIKVREVPNFFKDLKNSSYIYVVIVRRTDVGLELTELLIEYRDYYDVLFPIDEQRSKLVDGVEYTIDLRLGTVLPFRPLYY